MASGRQAGRLILVIAPSEYDYALWCSNSGKGRTSQYISCPEMLYGWGRVDIEVLAYPHWWTEEDTEQLDSIRAYSES